MSGGRAGVREVRRGGLSLEFLEGDGTFDMCLILVPLCLVHRANARPEVILRVDMGILCG